MAKQLEFIDDKVRETIARREIGEFLHRDDLTIYPIKRAISGTYRNSVPKSGTILELRVDVDGRRPQNRLSGDFFLQIEFSFGNWGIIKPFRFELHQKSFIVESFTNTTAGGQSVLRGTIKYYDDPTITDEEVEVDIPRVNIFSKPANAAVKIYKAGVLKETYCCAKISEYYRTVNLEIDRYQGTSYPPTAKKDVAPCPSDLTGTINTEQVFKNAGIDITVNEDDVLNDPDSGDIYTNWDEAELHQLMEDNFDRFGNRLQWNVYGVVVPKFGDPGYDSGYYGTMFDWGGWQIGDTFLRQGLAIAEDAIKGRSQGTLYDNADKKNRLLLQTFCHEIGHAFNLPHSWQRTSNPDSASESFMNYPWGYTGGTGGETQFWTNFRWEFDDDELLWMRHANRKDVIFGGHDWIGNNLVHFTEPEYNMENMPLELEVRGKDLFRFAEPVRLELKLKNVSTETAQVMNHLQPEDNVVKLYIKRPDGEHVKYIAPVRRLRSTDEMVSLRPGESLYESVLLSYGARGAQFTEPGEYLVRAYYGGEGGFVMSKALRIRIAAPHSVSEEELAHIMFDHRVAKFIYFRGGHRYPQMVSTLQEAADKFMADSPETCHQLQAVLGRHFSRDYKRLITKEGKRVLSVEKGNMKKAIKYMSDALETLPQTGKSALDNITYNRVTHRLIDCLQAQNGKPRIASRLEESLNYLKSNRVTPKVVTDYEKTIKKIEAEESVKV